MVHFAISNHNTAIMPISVFNQCSINLSLSEEDYAEFQVSFTSERLFVSKMCDSLKVTDR